MKILIIEDDPTVAKWEAATVEASQRIAAETFSVSTLQGALEFMRRCPVDAVILDPGLPDNPGRDAAGATEAMAREFPAVPIVVVTGRAWDKSAPNVEALLAKPVKAEGLVEALLGAITGKAARDKFAPIKASLEAIEDSMNVKPEKKAGPEQP